MDEGPVLKVTPDGHGAYSVDDGSRTWRVFVAGAGDRRQAFVEGEVFDLAIDTEGTRPSRGTRAATELLSAPMPARVTAIEVEPGQAVRKGDILLKLEAMKMELPVRAPREGTVSRIACRVGELVQPGVGLLEIA